MIIEALESRRMLAAVVPAAYSASTLTDALPGLTALEVLPNGRMLAAVKDGSLVLSQNVPISNFNSSLPTLRLNVNTDGERGLIGLAVDPNFAANGYVYLYYTSPDPAVHNRISRFTLTDGAIPASSEFVLLDLPPLDGPNHNGGALHFGPDGMLYAGVGDNRRPQLARDLTTPFGKMLRLRPDGTAPTDNPFLSTSAAKPGSDIRWQDFVWAKGLRNPFTFNFQPGSGLLYINDVGETTVEEVNTGLPGADYGWPDSEGPTNFPGVTPPTYSLTHGSGRGGGGAIAFSGGAFAPDGQYYLGDFGTGILRSLDPSTQSAKIFGTGFGSIIDVDVAADGALVVSSNDGTVTRVGLGTTGGIASDGPTITRQPASVIGTLGTPVTFSAMAAAGVTYQWQRNGTNIPGATSNTLTVTPAASDLAGGALGVRYRVLVTNASGTTTSSTALLTFDANRPPLPKILSPKPGSLYVAGSRIALKFDATDPDQKRKPADSSFAFRVLFQHDGQTDTFMDTTRGKRSATLTLPNTGTLSTNVSYRIELIVTDDTGRTATLTRDLLPKLVKLSFSSTPVPAEGQLDAVATTFPANPTAPLTLTSVAGMLRSISAPSEITASGTAYRLIRGVKGKFADGQTVFAAPTRDASYVLIYKAVKQ